MNRIKQLRIKQGITQEELGKLIGVQSSAISKYEKGIVPLTDDTIRELCKIFSVTSDYLICNDVKLANEECDKDTAIRRLLVRVGFINNERDLTDEQLNRIMDFLITNKKFFK